MTKLRKVLLLFVICMLVLITGAYAFLIKQREQKYIQHQKHYTTVNLIRTVTILISAAYIDTKQKPPANMKLIVPWLQQHTGEKDFNTLGRNINNGLIVDSWGNPLLLKIITNQEHVIYSSGPNEKDDNCSGDDIWRVGLLDK